MRRIEDRTVRIQSGRGSYGVVLGPPAYRWETAEPDDNLDYAADATDVLVDVNDTIISAKVSVSPFGSGDLTASALNVAGALISMRLSGGVPGRDYLVRIEAGTQAGRDFEWLVSLLVDPRLATGPLAPAVRAFGPLITWAASPSAAPSLNFSVASNSIYSLLIPGF